MQFGIPQRPGPVSVVATSRTQAENRDFWALESQMTNLCLSRCLTPPKGSTGLPLTVSVAEYANPQLGGVAT